MEARAARWSFRHMQIWTDDHKKRVQWEHSRVQADNIQHFITWHCSSHVDLPGSLFSTCRCINLILMSCKNQALQTQRWCLKPFRAHWLLTNLCSDMELPFEILPCHCWQSGYGEIWLDNQGSEREMHEISFPISTHIPAVSSAGSQEPAWHRARVTFKGKTSVGSMGGWATVHGAAPARTLTQLRASHWHQGPAFLKMQWTKIQFFS